MGDPYDMREERKETRRWWFFGLVLSVITIIVLTVLGYMGKFTGTVVERKVFENSYQYKEAQKREISIFEAQLVEISAQLSNQNLDENTRSNLEAQASALRVKLAAAKGR